MCPQVAEDLRKNVPQCPHNSVIVPFHDGAGDAFASGGCSDFSHESSSWAGLSPPLIRKTSEAAECFTMREKFARSRRWVSENPRGVYYLAGSSTKRCVRATSTAFALKGR